MLTQKLARLTARALMLAFLLAVGAAPALAQEEGGGSDQAHKQAFNAALETARAGQSAIEGQNYTEALSSFEEAVGQFSEAAQMSEQAGDSEVAAQARDIGSKVAYTAGQIALQQEQFADAQTHFEQGIEMNAEYANNYLGRAIAIQEGEGMEAAMSAFQEAIEMGEQYSDPEVVEKAHAAIRDHYVYMASQQLSTAEPTPSDASAALEYLEQMQEYVEPDASAYFYMATAHNILGNYEQAIEAAQQGLELERGGRSTQARYYFAIGEANMRLGNTEAARSAFQNAAYGEYRPRAEHYLETL